jgi:signal transduction histidine kinase
MTVGKLVFGVVHELGTPLNVITQRARMAATGEIDGPEARENAAIIAEQSERITRIVRQLLDFARQRTPETSRRDLVGIAERTVVLLTPLAGKQHVTLTLERPETPVHAEVDAMQIQQVLTNLVVNGIQAMPDGGNLRVRVGSGEASPPPDVGQRTRWAWVEVLDEGPGIPPEHLDHLFDPFFTTKPPGEGTGLGLPVAYGIVREHGGWIRVASPPGRGACFTVHLPEAES